MLRAGFRWMREQRSPLEPGGHANALRHPHHPRLCSGAVRAPVHRPRAVHVDLRRWLRAAAVRQRCRGRPLPQPGDIRRHDAGHRPRATARLRGLAAEQFALPFGWNHVQKTLQTARYAGCNYLRPEDGDPNTSLWGAYRGAPDRVHQRMVDALSQIMVVSQNLQHLCLRERPARAVLPGDAEQPGLRQLPRPAGRGGVASGERPNPGHRAAPASTWCPSSRRSRARQLLDASSGLASHAAVGVRCTMQPAASRAWALALVSGHGVLPVANRPTTRSRPVRLAR
jgi:hypothetical protein